METAVKIERITDSFNSESKIRKLLDFLFGPTQYCPQ